MYVLTFPSISKILQCTDPSRIIFSFSNGLLVGFSWSNDALLLLLPLALPLETEKRKTNIKYTIYKEEKE